MKTIHAILLALKTLCRASKCNDYLISRLRLRGDEGSERLASDLDYHWQRCLNSYAFNRFLIAKIAAAFAEITKILATPAICIKGSIDVAFRGSVVRLSYLGEGLHCSLDKDVAGDLRFLHMQIFRKDDHLSQAPIGSFCTGIVANSSSLLCVRACYAVASALAGLPENDTVSLASRFAGICIKDGAVFIPEVK